MMLKLKHDINQLYIEIVELLTRFTVSEFWKMEINDFKILLIDVMF